MPHGDVGDGEYARCGCSHCVMARKFSDFADLVEPPARPTAITDRMSVAQFMRWLAFEQMAELDVAASDGLAGEDA